MKCHLLIFTLATVLVADAQTVSRTEDRKPDNETAFTRIATAGCHKQNDPAPGSEGLKKVLTARPSVNSGSSVQFLLPSVTFLPQVHAE